MEHSTDQEAAVDGAWLAARLAALGLTVDPSTAAELARYAALVLAWGSRINLTGARTREVLVDEHLADAWLLLPWLPPGRFRFLDVGSGAGLPGLVLAMARPAAEGVLLEPRAKRHAFLAHAIRELGLAGRLEVRLERHEEHAAGDGYDVAISRATWPLAEWLTRGLPLVKPGGRVIGLGGERLGLLPAGAERHPYQLGRRRRTLVVLRRA